MNNKEFFKIINNYYKRQQMQIIPAFSFDSLPPYPFATYQTRKAITDDLRLDGREEKDGKLIERMAVRTEEEFLIKCYNSSDKLANETCIDLMNTIRFIISELIRQANYGIISIGDIRQYHEQTDGGYIYCYGFSIKIDYNHEVERIIDILETIELTGDINKIIKVKEV